MAIPRSLYLSDAIMAIGEDETSGIAIGNSVTPPPSASLSCSWFERV